MPVYALNLSWKATIELSLGSRPYGSKSSEAVSHDGEGGSGLGGGWLGDGGGLFGGGELGHVYPVQQL